MVTAWSIPQQNNIQITQSNNIQNNAIPKIAIAIPFKDTWESEWVERLYFPLKYDVNWCTKAIVLSKAPSITVARDSLVKSALKANADYILFVDSDMVLESPLDPNVALNQLYQVINKSKNKDDKSYKDARIVSGLYRAKQPSGFSYAMWTKIQDDNKQGFIAVQEWTGNWLQVDVIGMGFCLIDMQIFKEIPSPWFVWNETEKISEDFYFCSLAKKYGYDVRCFTDVKLSHLGKLKVKCNGSISTPDV